MWSTPQLRGKLLRVLITVTCSIAFVLFGYDQGVMGGVLGGSPFIQQFNNPSVSSPDTPGLTALISYTLQQGIITGVYDIGCLSGSLLAFIFSERMGRKRSILAGALVSLIGAVLQATSKEISQLIVARIVTGVGVGIMTANVPMWQSEISKAHNRGILLTVQSVNINSGFVLSTWITFGTAYVTRSQFQWIFPVGLQLIFPIYLLFTVPLLVESPRWIARHHSLDKATEVIARIWDLPEDHDEVLRTRNEIAVALEAEKAGSFWDLFRNGGQQNCRRMLLGVAALSMQQLTGINSVAYYIPVILKDYVGLSNVVAHIAAAAGSTQCLCFSFTPIFFIERVGRRKCLLFGAAAMTVTMVLICIGFNVPGRGGAIMVTVMYFIFYDAFTTTYLNVPWMYAPEINSLKMRSQGMALASTCNWLLNGVIVTVTPMGLQNLGWRFYIIWAVINASFVPLVYFFFPKTGGLSLEQIDHIFEGKGHGWSGLTQGVHESINRPLIMQADAEHGQVVVENGDSCIALGTKSNFPTSATIEDVKSPA